MSHDRREDLPSDSSAAALRISIVSGYFNPLHVGHLRMMAAASELGNRLVVIVNNDEQQLMKKGRIITSLEDRLEIVRALRIVDEAVSVIKGSQQLWPTLVEICYFQKVRKGLPQLRVSNQQK